MNSTKKTAVGAAAPTTESRENSTTVSIAENKGKSKKAAWNLFGKSYEYRRKYNEYKAQRMAGGSK